jgi:hypothetical protein
VVRCAKGGIEREKIGCDARTYIITQRSRWLAPHAKFPCKISATGVLVLEALRGPNVNPGSRKHSRFLRSLADLLRLDSWSVPRGLLVVSWSPDCAADC